MCNTERLGSEIRHHLVYAAGGEAALMGWTKELSPNSLTSSHLSGLHWRSGLHVLAGRSQKARSTVLIMQQFVVAAAVFILSDLAYSFSYVSLMLSDGASVLSDDVIKTPFI